MSEKYSINFYLPIHWCNAQPFNVVEIKFNCKVKTNRVYIGDPLTPSVDPDKLPPSNARCIPVGDNTEDLEFYFPDKRIGEEGGPTSITVYLHTDSPIRPEIQSVLLSLKDQGPGWPYSSNDIDNLNQKYIPP